MAFAKVQARGADLTTHIGPEIRLLLALVTANSPGTLVSIFGVLMLGTALEIAIAGPKLETAPCRSTVGRLVPHHPQQALRKEHDQPECMVHVPSPESHGGICFQCVA